MVVENQSQAQIDADFQASGLLLTKEQVKAERKKLGIGTSFAAKVAFNRGMSDNRTVEIHNQYAKQIFAEGYGDDPVLMNLAKQYIAELPKAARKGQERDYITACEAKLDAFRAAVRDYNLGVNQGILDDNAQTRHEESELTADLRTAQTQQVVAQTGKAVINQVNTHTDESNAAQTREINAHTSQVGRNINANTNRVGNSVVRRVNTHTTAVGNQVTQNVNAHTDEVSQRVIHDVTQNMSAITGVDAEGYTVKDGEDRRVLANGNEITDKDNVVAQVNAHTTEEVDRGVGEVNAHTTKEVNRGVGEVNTHTTKEHNATRLQQQQQAVLDAKRQTMSDMLMNEVNELFPGPGFYKDSTVKWLGSSADRVMAGTDLTFEEKKEALDELIRMIDEENVISDGDKDAFEAKYFRRTEERPHI